MIKEFYRFYIWERKLRINFLGVDAQDQSDRKIHRRIAMGNLEQTKTASHNREAVRMRKMDLNPHERLLTRPSILHVCHSVISANTIEGNAG